MTAPRRALIAGSVAAALLSGCSTASMYDGPDPPQEDLAILEGYWHYYFVAVRIVIITSVDGKPVPGATGDVTRILLTPGRHTIGLRVGAAFGEVGSSSQCTFEAQFERGHRYRVDSFDAGASESDIGLEVKTEAGGAVTTRAIPCQRTRPRG